MRFRSILCGLVALSLVAPQPAVAAGLLTAPDQAQDDRAERERKRNAERAARDAADKAKDYEETMKEVKAELDELGADLLRARYADQFLQDYVNELGQSLIPKETPPGVLFSFRVLNDPEPNAFALPDGRVYVNSGLLIFVENEAQLAVILGHEIAHVTEQHYVESVRSQKREALVGTVLGAAAGAVLGGIFGGKKGAAEGVAVGALGGLVVAKVRMNSYNRKQEDEADSVGAMLALDRRYDARQAVGFFKQLSETYGDQGRFANALYGRHSRNKDRMVYIDQLLTGNLAGKYNELRTAGQLSNGTGQMHMYASRMIRDVSIVLMDQFDHYGVAKERLERIADYRASDPRTLWALGRVYKLVGRTDQDKAKALDYLQRAAQLDERNLFPYLHRDLGLMQARLGSTPAAVESLKKYISISVQKHYVYPADLEEMYDYLLAFGDRNWTAPAIDPLLIRAVNPGPAAAGQTAVEAPAAMPAGQGAKPATAKPGTAKPDTRKPEIKKPGGGVRQ